MGKFLGVIDFRRFGRFWSNLFKGAAKDIQRIVKEVGLSEIAKNQIKQWIKINAVPYLFAQSDDVFSKVGKIILNAKTDIADKQFEVNLKIDSIPKPDLIPEEKWKEIINEVKKSVNELITEKVRKPIDTYSVNVNEIKQEVDDEIVRVHKEAENWIDNIDKL